MGEEPQQGAARRTSPPLLPGLCQLLASGLAHAGATAAAVDQAACQDAARYARQIHALLTGDGP